MSHTELTKGAQSLVGPAIQYFRKRYQNKPKLSQKIHEKLSWIPSLYVRADRHLIVAAEASEYPYPQTLRLIREDIMGIPLPIIVFCVCPEETYLKEEQQSIVEQLREHGYGLVTIDRAGIARLQFTGIPLIQHISVSEFSTRLTRLPKRLRSSTQGAYDIYRQNARSGVSEISQLVEALINCAAMKAVKKGWIPKDCLKRTVANRLDAMIASKQMRSVKASLGGARAFMKLYRNPASHPPRTSKEAAKRYADLRLGFLNGLVQLEVLDTEFDGLGFRLTT